MADHRFYRVFRRSFAGDKVVDYGHVDDLIYIKVARKYHIHNRADFTRITVFKRKYRTVAFSALDRIICACKFAESRKFRFGEHSLCRQLRKCAFRAAVRNFYALYRL